jgi:hypothetical protein
MKTSLPRDLLTAVNEKRLIPVIGAGVSLSILSNDNRSIFPSWRGLLELAAKRISDENKADTADGLLSMIKLGRYQMAAELARDGLTGRLWGNFFKENFLLKKEELRTESLALPKAIWTLSNRVITLNYDKVLRFAAPEPESIAEIDNLSLTELADFVRGDPKVGTIWHLHGRLDNVANIIFTQESYKLLYSSESNQQAALEALRSTCRDNTLLFVGCSLDDADLLQQISMTHTLFAQHTGPHYALIKEADRAAIQAKIKGLPIILIGFSDYGTPLVDIVGKIAGAQASERLAFGDSPAAQHLAKGAQDKDTQNETKPTCRVAVLISQPIDRDYSYSEYLKELRKLKCEVTFYPLTLSNLQDLGRYDYIFVLSKVSRQKLVIEDAALSSRRISLKDLETNIGTPPTKAVILLLDHALESDLDVDDIKTLAMPTIIFPKLVKTELEIFNFKVFKKAEPTFVPHTITLNSGETMLAELKGTNREVWCRTRLPQNVDVKIARNFVGRVTDLATLSRKIVELPHKGEILTIKGAGGIGKTQTLKRVLIALAERNLFADGITFIDCEFIRDYKILENSIASAFNLQDAINLRAQLFENAAKRDALVVLDNVETLLYLSDTPAIKDFLNFICDYATFITTSRELLSLDCEDVYELRQLTTEEACELFFQEIGTTNVQADQRDFIKTHIVESLLDNNPLAIKLIAKNMPSGKNFSDLKSELEHDLFMRVSEAEMDMFDSYADTNIERKRSLFASINYSYNRLNSKERTAFELVSLFPGGINLENLKNVSENFSNSKTSSGKQSAPVSLITDTVIRALENKSLIEVENGMVTLQSILGKFASRQLNLRPIDELKRYHRNALQYCYALADHIQATFHKDQYQSRKMTSAQQSNFIKSIDYADASEIGSDRFANYLGTLTAMFVNVSIGGVLLQALRNRSDATFPNETARLCFELIKVSLEYYEGNFDSAFARLQQLAPIDQLMLNDSEGKVEKVLSGRLEDIYGMEGETLWAARSEAKRRAIYGYYPHYLLHLGIFSNKLVSVCGIDFFTLEAMYSMDMLSADFVEDYLATIYEKGHLEIMQSHYVLAKLRPISKERIERLVIINPYTAGLKHLMLALTEQQPNLKNNYFELAGESLFHIKYYYVECLYFFAQFLQQAGLPRFDEVHTSAVELSSKYNYRYLLHRLNALVSAKPSQYPLEDYPQGYEEEFRHYLDFLVKEHGRRKQRSQTPSLRNS